MAKASKLDPELVWAIEEAIQKEQIAQVFYTKASGLATSKAVKALFKELKADEVEHEAMLKEVLKDVVGGKAIKKVKVLPVEPLEKGFLEMFTKGKPSAATRLDEAMDIAMTREEDARKGYERLAGLSPTEALKDLFNFLAHVEAGHLRRLKNLYAKGHGA